MRKTYGASVQRIIVRLIREFSIWVIIANVFAWPLSWYFMKNWLQGFAYQSRLHWWLFLAGSFVALLMAVGTVFSHAYKHARRNPVDNLKDE